MKTCKGCDVEKPLDDFYKHPKTQDCRASKCKECAKVITRAARAKNVEYYRAYDNERANDPGRVAARAAYAATEDGKAARIRARKRWQSKHPKRKAAHDAVNSALQHKKLTKQPCFMCGCEEVEAHHADYDRPLDVVWLCVAHHKEIHWGGK